LKTFSYPFQNRLDELLKRNCETAVKSENIKIGNANSLTGSNQSSHSPSVAGESLDVKVEITPAPPTPMSDIHNSYSIESTSSLTLCSDVSSKSQVASPMLMQAPNRKFSEIPHETSGSFLTPIGNFNRMNPSPPNSASGRLFKKLEEMIDLSSPYNHYRCLSPSETNLSIPMHERSQSISPNAKLLDASRPGSSRLLRRQFSLDKDDLSSRNHGNLETISSLVDSTKHSSLAVKSPYQPLISSSSLPANSSLISTKIHKHQSTSVAQDLEKIEEIPISPINTSLLPINSNSSTKDSNSFKNLNSNNNLKTSLSNDSKDVTINIESLG
jgi:guanylate cyclase 2F